MENYVVNVIVFGVISWTTLFLATRKLLPKRSFDFCNRIVSTVHACLAVTLASLSVQDWKCPVCPLASKSSPKQVGFAVIFTFARMGGGPYLTYVTLSADNPLLIKAMALGLQLVSAFWFYKIARMMIYKLAKRTSPIKTTKTQ
ncbi:hypothetical protein BUALT_Bualt08G0075000 [Buddleja alternifolia]|uniref:TLC domain-containing protein n=1 Tax=Buddleja alternifolia TaxID=168488 RepID=A0AAV6XBN6_9LAMI|nr:hypothetical protein BUALT_Bualt08G0075000 [Buddleja alternifolia]